jgi:hypothetical protein
VGALTLLPPLTTQLAATGAVLVVLGVVHLVLPRALGWRGQLAALSGLNREVTYVHCYFIGLSCVLWGLLPLVSGPALLTPDPVTRAVLVGAVLFWGSRLVVQVGVFNRHARESASWCALSIAGTALWLYITGVWVAALAAQR